MLKSLNSSSSTNSHINNFRNRYRQPLSQNWYHTFNSFSRKKTINLYNFFYSMHEDTYIFTTVEISSSVRRVVCLESEIYDMRYMWKTRKFAGAVFYARFCCYCSTARNCTTARERKNHYFLEILLTEAKNQPPASIALSMLLSRSLPASIPSNSPCTYTRMKFSKQPRRWMKAHIF